MKDSKIPDALEEAAGALDTLAGDERVQEFQKGLLARVPRKVRGVIYEAGKWVGLAGGAALAVAGVLTGDAARYVEAGGLLALAVSNWIAKANLS